MTTTCAYTGAASSPANTATAASTTTDSSASATATPGGVPGLIHRSCLIDVRGSLILKGVTKVIF
jgi:hypothetical protein